MGAPTKPGPVRKEAQRSATVSKVSPARALAQLETDREGRKETKPNKSKRKSEKWEVEGTTRDSKKRRPQLHQWSLHRHG